MKMRKALLCSGLSAVLGSAGVAVQAAMLMTGDRLTFDAGVAVYDSYGNPTDVSSGSYFVCDCNGDFKIQSVEKSAMAPGSSGGIVIGTTQAPGEIDAVWSFFGLPGSHYTATPVTGGTTYGLDLSGWAMYWNEEDISLGDGAWTPTNCGAAGVACAGYGDGIAVFNWSGVYGDSYTLDYSALFPVGSAFYNAAYFLHLEGVVMSAVSVPGAAWLLASGLLALGFDRRRSSKAVE